MLVGGCLFDGIIVTRNDSIEYLVIVLFIIAQLIVVELILISFVNASHHILNKYVVIQSGLFYCYVFYEHLLHNTIKPCDINNFKPLLPVNLHINATGTYNYFPPRILLLWGKMQLLRLYFYFI